MDHNKSSRLFKLYNIRTYLTTREPVVNLFSNEDAEKSGEISEILLEPQESQVTPEKYVISQLNNLEQVKDFLVPVEASYRKAEGNLPVFRRLLEQSGHDRLFNILIEVSIEPRYFSSDYWDTLAFHLLMAWCHLYGLKYRTKHLVQIIQETKQTN